MKKIKTAIIGTGFMGKVHTENVRRLGNVEVAAVVGSRPETAQKFADAMYIPFATANLKDVLDNKEIAAVHICTPNVDHCPMSLAAIDAGKAVLCEKPLTMTSDEARQFVAAAKAKNAVNCVQHNLRYYPVVQQMRQMIAHGDLGEILVVQGTYSQDWLLYDTDWNWRLDAKLNGKLRVMGDIGSHWMDMIQHLTGLSITEVCADLMIFHKTRKKPKGSVETFSGKKVGAGRLRIVPDRYRRLRHGDAALGRYGARCFHREPDVGRIARIISPLRFSAPRPASPGIRNSPIRFGSATATNRTKSSSKTLRCSIRKRPDLPICQAATAKVMTIPTNRFSNAFMPRLPILQRRSIIPLSKMACAA